MTDVNLQTLHLYTRQFSGLTEEKIQTLHEVYETLQPDLQQVTDTFYEQLSLIPKTKAFIEGRIDQLKLTHIAWLNELFVSNFDEDYTAKLYKIGDVHVKVNLPVEFVSGAMSIIQGELTVLIVQKYTGQTDKQLKILEALNSALSFCSLVMQESYQTSALAEELDKFLTITGMSRKLFDNLARVYSKKT